MSGRPVVGAGEAACPPDVLSKIADLELVARIVVEGLVSGLHRSPFHGYSAEFSQYRHYRQGDDLKYVDWKLLARTDRLYTKQFRETTNMAAQLVVDTSASMDFPSGVSKFRYAVICAAALAHLITSQGDAVGLLASADSRELFLAPRTGRQHLRGLLAALSAATARGTWRPGETVRRAADRLTRRGLLVVSVRFLRRRRADVHRIGARVANGTRDRRVSNHEPRGTGFPVRSRRRNRGPRNRTRCSAERRAGAPAVQDDVATFLEACRSRAAANGFRYSLVVTDVPPERALRNFLLRRTPG